jgi:hypothetical protein
MCDEVSESRSSEAEHKVDIRMPVLTKHSGVDFADMSVVADVVFAIAQGALALAAVSKLDRRIGLVGDSADDAFVFGLLRVGAGLSTGLYFAGF